MAQTGYTPIQLYYSTTAAAVPTAGNLASGELAINITDGKLYYKNNSGTVTLLAGSGGGGPAAGSNTQIQFNNSGVFGASSSLTWDGTYLTAGSIKDSALTSGRVTFAGASGLLTDSANLTFNGTDLTVSGAVNAGSINATTLDLTNLEVTNIKAKDGTASMSIADSTGVVTVVKDQVVNGLTVGRGGGAVSTNTAVGASAIAATATATRSTAVGFEALKVLTSGDPNTALGAYSLKANTIGAGNVGIGAYALQTNISGGSNTAVGNEALSLSTGNYNTAVGANALISNTTASYNTAVGHQAGYANTAGQYNAYVGAYSGYYNQTGNGNTALGYGAFTSTGTGDSSTENTAVGFQSLQTNTTGNYNTALGSNALRANTTASSNTAVGYQASYTSTLATGVTSIGYQANYSMTTTGTTYSTAVGYQAAKGGSGATNYDDVAVGAFALAAITSGINNVAVGKQALQANTTASGNTAVGYQAGYNNTTDGYNTYLGYQAGYSNDTGAYNTFVGQGAGYYFNPTSSVNGFNTFIGQASGDQVTTGTKNTILGRYSGNQGGLDIRTVNNQIVLSDGDGTPWWRFDGTLGVASQRQYGYANIVPYMKISGFGYDQSSYKVIVLGGRTLSGTNCSLSFGYDPSNNAGGSFSGLGAEMLFPNGVNFKSPNSGNTNFFNVMDFDASGYGIKLYGNVGVGGAQPASSGGGVTFPATQVASSDANTLDDYEEGTWTATLVSSGGGSVTISTLAKYIKVGNLVFVSMDSYAISTTGLSSGYLEITGLPFSCNINSAAVAYFDIAGAVSASQGSVVGYAGNSTTISLYKSESTSSSITQLQNTDLNSNVSIRFNATYTV